MGSSAFPTASVSPADLAPAPFESLGSSDASSTSALRDGAKCVPRGASSSCRWAGDAAETLREEAVSGVLPWWKRRVEAPPPFKFLFPKTDISSPQRQAEALVLGSKLAPNASKRKTHVADIIVYSLRSRHPPAEFRVLTRIANETSKPIEQSDGRRPPILMVFVQKTARDAVRRRRLRPSGTDGPCGGYEGTSPKEPACIHTNASSNL